MPKASYDEHAPFKVVRCRFYNSRGQAFYGPCPDGGYCRFLHPHDRGWPGLDPKPLYRLESSPPLDSPPISRKRARSPLDQPRRSFSPEGRSVRRGRSLSPSRAPGSSYINKKYNKLLRYRQQSPRYRRERSPLSPPRPTYRTGEWVQRGPSISGVNSIPLISPRSNRSRLSVDTSRVSSSPEIRTPTTREERGAKVFLDWNYHELGDPKSRNLKSSEDAPGPTTERVGFGPLAKRTDNSLPNYKPTKDPPGQAPVAPKKVLSSETRLLAPSGPSNILALINKLTKVHLRLLDNRKSYEDESLKLQAFESLATKFEIPIAYTATATATPPVAGHVPGFGPFGSAFTTSATHTNAFGATSSSESKETPTGPRKMQHGRSTSLPLSPQRIGKHVSGFAQDVSVGGNASLAMELDRATSADKPSDDFGQKIAHEALLETLDGIRERKMKVGKRVRDDFEEMALVLETIWMGTFDVRNAPVAKRVADNAEDQNVLGSSAKALSNNVGQSAPTATVTKANRIAPSHLSDASVALPTVMDADGKVVKKMRRVSFDDEIGTSQQEKDSLRRLEEKIVGMERKLAKVAALEKENVKMKAELKSQKGALDAITKSLEEQDKVIDELVAAHATSNLTKMEVEEPPHAILAESTP